MQIPGYEHWAIGARQQAKEVRENRVEDQIKSLNDATKTLVASLQGQIVALQNAFDTYRQKSEEDYRNLAEQNRAILEQLQLLPQQLGLALAGSFQVAAAAPPPAAPTRRAAAPTAAAAPTTQQHNDVAATSLAAGAGGGGELPLPLTFPPPPPPPAAATAPAAPAAAAPQGNPAREARAQLVRTNALQYIGGRARQPVVDKAKIPSTWVGIQDEWERLGFEAFRHLSMKEWPNKEHKGRYIKRKTAVDEIDRFGNEHLLSWRAAAIVLDTERTARKKTLNQHLAQLRQGNPFVSSRTQLGRRTRVGLPRRRVQVEQVARAARVHPADVVAAVGARPRPAPTYNFNNSQSARIAQAVITTRNIEQVDRHIAMLTSRLGETADVLEDGVLEDFRRVRDGRRG